MNNPILTIITINLNNANGLRRTIESVVNQTYTVFEYIIIDGGSTDGSVEVIKEYHEKITFWVSEPDKGIYNAMNKGILKATGEYCLFLNSEDTLINSKVLFNIFGSTFYKEDILYGDLVRIFPNGKTDVVTMPDYISPSFLYNASLAHPVTFIKKSLFLKFGMYNETYSIVADHAFFIKIFLTATIQYRHLNLVITNFMMNGTCSKVGNFMQIQEERYKAIKDQLSPEYIQLIIDKNIVEESYNLLLHNKVVSLIKKTERKITKSKKFVKKIYKRFWIYRLLNPFNVNKYTIPIIINNRNRITHLLRLINSLEKRGYSNIHIIDNNSDYPPLLDFYKSTQHKIYKLNFNSGFCALWDSDIFDQFFKDKFYIYTDSDMELTADCPDNFLDFMMFQLWKYKNIDKIGLSLNINDLPDHYSKKLDVIKFESQYWEHEFDKNLYDADVDTTFALYRKNKIGPAGYIKALRLKPPYSVKHLPWYENSDEPTEEDIYYNIHSQTRTLWTKKPTT